LETIYFGDKERVKFKAKLVEGLSEGVVVADPGWWFPEADDPEHGCFDSNINLVIPNDIYEPIYGSINLRSIPCRSISFPLPMAVRRCFFSKLQSLFALQLLASCMPPM